MSLPCISKRKQQTGVLVFTDTTADLSSLIVEPCLNRHFFARCVCVIYLSIPCVYD